MPQIEDEIAVALAALAQKRLDKRVEEVSRQEILNVALFRIVNQQGGSVTLPFDVVNADGMGGIGVEVNPATKTVTFSTVTAEQAEAMQESETTEKH